jgi:hypothetical protein
MHEWIVLIAYALLGIDQCQWCIDYGRKPSKGLHVGYEHDSKRGNNLHSNIFSREGY